MHGHEIATHRSAPEASGQTELYLVQSPQAPIPSIEVTRHGVRLALPLEEAGGLAEAVADSRRLAGVRS